MARLFNLENYYSKLKTNSLGRPCIFLDKVDTTIDAVQQEPKNTLVMAKEQTKGRGQRANIWHSPVGCAMGSIRLNCLKVSPLAKRLCFVQHIVALSTAWTLEKLDSRLGKNRIGLKWPNDIIYLCPETAQQLKIGGILVHTMECVDSYDITLSFGLNVFNEEPTTCIKKILGSEDGVSMDTIVAEIMNHLEEYTYGLDDEKFNHARMDYIGRCIQINKLIQDETHGSVRVKDVDDNGYLIGEKSDHQLCTITKIIAA